MSRIVTARSVTVKVNGKNVVLMEGAELPKGVAKKDVDTLDRLAALDRPVSYADVGNVGAANEPAAPISAANLDVPQIAELIKAGPLSSDDTIALAEGDQTLAAKVLEAEGVATNGSPRPEVKDGLEKLTA